MAEFARNEEEEEELLAQAEAYSPSVEEEIEAWTDRRRYRQL